jgi:small-conductance mechanosensitive channel
MIETIVKIFTVINLDIVLSILAILFYIIVTLGLQKIMNRKGLKQSLPKPSRIKIIRLSKQLIGILTIFVLILIWGLDINDIWVFSSVVLGFIGVAIFATWSLLSNIFAAYILFFTEPFQIGDTILSVEGDNSIKGEVCDMTTFYIKIKLEDGSIGNIPNNVILQKAIIVTPQALLKKPF